MEETFERFEMIVTHINSIYRSIQKIKSFEMTELGLKGTQVMCLYMLRQNKEGLTSAELSSLCTEDKAAVSRAVGELEEAGLAYFEDSEGKRRYRSKIYLTEKGKKSADIMRGMIENAVNRGGEGITDEERAIFYKALIMISNNLKNFC
ncbi:MAG: MarR family transcriptional regulator [Clostridiales bacterium]|nr:MarR family transcriptional regulator [Clostridiales bacterium]